MPRFFTMVKPIYLITDPETGAQQLCRSAVKAVREYCKIWNYDIVKYRNGDMNLWAMGRKPLGIYAEDGDFIASGNTYVELAQQFVDARDGLSLF
ncbi:MAG: hypothetical protein JO004_10885 [Methylobacteriaceae bacterium]|nr:hypothetical protein [Methylobacteriaceae bacterium]